MNWPVISSAHPNSQLIIPRKESMHEWSDPVLLPTQFIRRTIASCMDLPYPCTSPSLSLSLSPSLSLRLREILTQFSWESNDRTSSRLNSASWRSGGAASTRSVCFGPLVSLPVPGPSQRLSNTETAAPSALTSRRALIGWNPFPIDRSKLALSCICQ